MSFVNRLLAFIKPGEPVYPWMLKAQTQLGIHEIPGHDHNQQILEYHKATWLKAKDDETAWCASFVSWCLGKWGLFTPRAKDYLVLEPVNPVYGCILVRERGPGLYHVGFFVGTEGDRVLCLGGNQGDSVCVTDYARNSIVGYRWPRGFPLPAGAKKV